MPLAGSNVGIGTSIVKLVPMPWTLSPVATAPREAR
jgi:hypothetical protein